MNFEILHQVKIIRGEIKDVNNLVLEKECLQSYKNNKSISLDDTDTRNEDLIISKNNELNKLFSNIQNLFQKQFNQKTILQDFWAQVHGKNESTNIHDHVNILDLNNSPNYSGVYYVKIPKNSGKLVFQYPINKYNQSERYYYEPEVGDFFLFPSTLDHFVTKNKTNNYRIAISFNLKIK